MPSILFHMKVGIEFIKKNPNLDKPQFYLGLIVPDAVNVDGFAPKEKRWPAHLRDKDLDIWENNIIDFYKNNKEKYEELYLYGYVVHVLADIVCDRVYTEEVKPLLKGKNIEDTYEYYRNEIEKYENSQVEEEWWKKVIENLEIANPITINGISADMIKRWEKYTLKNYKDRPKESSNFITDSYVENIANKIEEILHGM